MTASDENSSPAASDGFFVAAFVIDGSLEGLARWDSNDLSPKWTNICNDLLRGEGGNFDYNWTDGLSHIRTQFTSTQGAAICTFFVDNQVAASILLLRGGDPAAEDHVSRLFVTSLRKTSLVQASAASPEPFVQALSLPERPLMVVVPFPIADISDQDVDIVRELSLHMGAAFLGAQS